MTERKMTPTSFLKKTMSKASIAAVAFIEAYREYLVSGEVSSKTAPIVAKVDAGEILATMAMPEIRKAVLAHIQEVDRAKEDLSIVKQTKISINGCGTKRSFTSYIRNGSGEVVEVDGEELKSSFDLPQRASEWIDRKLFDGSPDWFGEIYHNVADESWQLINREQSIYRLLQKKASPVMKHQKSSSKLSWGVKAKTSKVTFSYG